MAEVLAAVAEVTFDVLSAVGVPAATAAAIATSTIVAAEVATVALTVAELFQPTPKPDAIREVLRQAIPPRRRGIGTARLGGSFLVDYANAANDLFRVVACVDGPVTNISRRYLAQDRIVVGSNTVLKMANGAYPNNCANFVEQFGATGVNAFASISPVAGLSSEAPQVWPTSASGTNIFMIYTRFYGGSLQSYTTAYPRQKATASVVGQVNVAYDWRDLTQDQADPTTWKNSANPIVGLVTELFRFRDYDWTLDFLPALDILTDEANRCDAAIGVLNVLTQVVVFVGTGGNHIIVDQTDPVPPNGVSLFYGGQTFTVASTSIVTVGGVTGLQINLSGGTLLANSIVQSVARWQASVGHPMTEPTYAVGGVWNATDDEATVVKLFIEAMDGFMIRRPSDGAVIIRCGHYDDPTVVIGADEVISYSWGPNLEYGKAVTELAPAFVAAAYDYTQTDTTLWRDDDAVALYGLNSQPFQPALVQSNGQVRRLSKRRLSRLLAHPETLTLKLSAIRAIGERYIRVQMGDTEPDELADVVLEVIGEPEINAAGLSITFPVAPADPDIDAWDPYTEEGDGPADSSPGQGPGGGVGVDAPTITDVSPFTQANVSGSTTTLGERLQVFAQPPASNQVPVADLAWQVQWRVVGATSWNVSGFQAGLGAGPTVEIDTGFVPTDQLLEVQVRYQTGARTSDWSASANPDAGMITEGGVQMTTEGGQSMAIDP